MCLGLFANIFIFFSRLKKKMQTSVRVKKLVLNFKMFAIYVFYPMRALGLEPLIRKL
jgi:hypothetical protein